MAQTTARMVDFRKLKERVSITDILDHYGIELKSEGDKLKGACPLCGGSRRTRKFSVTPSMNAWKCFDCDAGGNQLDLVAAMEKTGFREAAVIVADWFGITDCEKRRGRKNDDSRRAEPARSRQSPTSSTREAATPADYGDEAESDGDAGGQELRHNPPLNWDKPYQVDPEHEAIEDAGLAADTVSNFESGWKTTGIHKDRLAVPIHNGAGDLLGYCGVALDGRTERLKWPPKFEQGWELYNVHRAQVAAQYEEAGLVIVEDFLDVFQLFEAGVENAVAMIGDEFTEQQLLKLKMIDSPSGKVTLFLNPANRHASAMTTALAGFAWVRLVTPEDRKHPRELSPSMIEELLA